MRSMSWVNIKEIFFDKETGYLELHEYTGKKHYGRLLDIKENEVDIGCPASGELRTEKLCKDCHYNDPKDGCTYE